MYRENALPPPRPPRVVGAGQTPGWAWPATVVFLGAMAAILLSLPGWDYRIERVVRRLELGWAVPLAVVSVIGPALLLSALRSQGSARLVRPSWPHTARVILVGGLVAAMVFHVLERVERGGLSLVVPVVCLCWLVCAGTLSRTALLRFGWGVDELIRGRDATIPLTECMPPGSSGVETSRALAAGLARWMFALFVFAAVSACVACLLFFQTIIGAVVGAVLGLAALVALLVGALLALIGLPYWVGFCASFLRTRTALRARADKLELCVDSVWRSVVSHEVVGTRIRFDADGYEVWCAPPGGLGPKRTSDGRDPSANRRIGGLDTAITRWRELAAR